MEGTQAGGVRQRDNRIPHAVEGNPIAARFVFGEFMSKSMNRASLIGYVGQDPEVKYLTGGTVVATFSLATTESWKDNQGNLQERTEWHRLVAWNKLAEIIHKFIKKGSHLFVEGAIRTRSYDDAQTGVKRYITEINVRNLLMLDKKEGGSPSPAAFDQSPAEVPQSGPPVESADGLPF